MANHIDASAFQHSQGPSSEIQPGAFQQIPAFDGTVRLSRLKSIHLSPLVLETGVPGIMPYQASSIDTQNPPLTLRSFTPTRKLPHIPAIPFLERATAPLPIQRTLPEASHESGQFQVEQLKVMSLKQRKQYLVLAALWIAVNIYFWLWWFDAGHVGNPLLYGLMSVALFYSATVLPSFYTFYLGQMRTPKAIDVARVESSGVVGKVAVISLTVPGSESLAFVKRQMVAMKEIQYPHDSWIIVDKEHTPEIQALAESLRALQPHF